MNGMSCADAQRQFFAYLDRALAGDEVEALEEHLESCLECCGRLQFDRKLDSFVRSRLGEEPLPPDVEERIERALLAAAAAGTEG